MHTSTHPPSPIYVLDTSAVINVKEILPREKWQLVFAELERRVMEGTIVVVKGVIEELTSYKGQDEPKQWARRVSKYAHNPSDAMLRKVLQKAGGVVDTTKTRVDADPEVLAQALELKGKGHQVYIVHNDIHNTPSRISLRSAVELLQLQEVSPREFLTQIGL